jgi:hypothetical protein
MESTRALPEHGPIQCRKCFTDDAEVTTVGQWKAVNDPGAWGAAQPTILVLGFSKGFTQADAYKTGTFEEVPFKKMRPRLTAALRRVGLLHDTEIVETKFASAEQEFGFGSLVRCSLSRWNKKNRRWECTGQVMPLAFKEPVKAMVHQCASTFLSELPPSVRLVVMLGTGDPYITGCKALIRSMYRGQVTEINSVAYETPSVLWVHLTHPSRGNGYFSAWLSGATTDPSGKKLHDALSALSRFRESPLRSAI